MHERGVHAYAGRATARWRSRAALGDRELSVIVRDEGRGIVPRADSPGLGLGLPLIATLTESLELGTGEDDATEVRMTFGSSG